MVFGLKLIRMGLGGLFNEVEKTGGMSDGTGNRCLCGRSLAKPIYFA